MAEKYIHKSVLLHEAVDYLNIKPTGIYVDATTGGAGHSSLILAKLTSGHLYCFDQDDYALMRAKKRLSEISDNFTLVKANFKDLKSALLELEVSHIDGIIYDLGVSSFQFDIPDRGFSYNYDAPLDMRMDQTKELTAEHIVNDYSFNDICYLLRRYSDEADAKYIARAIEKARNIKRIKTTFELVDVIKSGLTSKRLSKKGHPAKKTFQSLRIAVNDELRVFEVSINDALDIMNKGGRAVVITFHSLEDRIAKTVFKERSTVNIPIGLPVIVDEIAPYKLITRKPIVASDEELKENNRAHSAKLRVIERTFNKK